MRSCPYSFLQLWMSSPPMGVEVWGAQARDGGDLGVAGWVKAKNLVREMCERLKARVKDIKTEGEREVDPEPQRDGQEQRQCQRAEEGRESWVPWLPPEPRASSPASLHSDCPHPFRCPSLPW